MPAVNRSRPARRILPFLLCSLCCSVAHAIDKLPLIDAHSHYSAADSAALSPKQIIDILDANGVAKIVITGTPNQGTDKLYLHAPTRIIPFLSVYRTKADKVDWMHRPTILEAAKKALAKGVYQGIGELHIFAKDRHSAVLRGLVKLAQDHNLPLLIHADAEVIDEVYQINPQARVLWAHLGTRPDIDLLQKMLDKYPNNLFIDTSVRDKTLLGNEQTNGDQANRLQPQWQAFIRRNQNRILAAVDTFSVNRWQNYHLVVKDIRTWLGDLPPDIAEKVAFQNAATFFAIR